MIERRIFEGTGVHDCDCMSDCNLEYISVDNWVQRPDDVKGQTLDIGKMVPARLKVNQASCGKWGRENFVGDLSRCPYPHQGDVGVCHPPRFRFRVTVEIEDACD
ncbi:MAG: hypothetical protein IBX68_11675 [Dehalococcoidia bacterium]|nr:hypothetical protein [Dehalococcoidia bacterium]